MRERHSPWSKAPAGVQEKTFGVLRMHRVNAGLQRWRNSRRPGPEPVRPGLIFSGKFSIPVIRDCSCAAESYNPAQ